MTTTNPPLEARQPIAALPPIERASRDQPLKLSFAQQRLWFLAQLGSADRDAYQTEEHQQISRDEKDHLLAMMQVEALGNEELELAFAQLKIESDSMDFATLMQRCLSLKRELIPAHLADLPETEVEMFLHRQIALHSAMAEYRAEPIDIFTHLFIATETDLGQRFARFRGWDQVLPEARIKSVLVPGNHYSMMKLPHVKTLCAGLDGFL